MTASRATPDAVPDATAIRPSAPAPPTSSAPAVPGAPMAPPVPSRGAARLLLSPWARLALLVLLVGAAAGAVLLWEPQRSLTSGAGGLASGVWAGPAFVAVYALGTFAFVPKPALSAAAGALFGIAYGLPLAVAGTTAGAVAAFAAARLLGRDALRPLLRGRVLTALDRRLTRHGFGGVLALRLLPGVPFAAVNFGAALSGVRPGPFTAATLLGTVPGNAVYVAAGASASAPASPVTWIVGAGCAVLLGAVPLWRAAVRRRAARSSPAVSPDPAVSS
ncbi:TVP38/TMEM64 family protein [Streptosporangium sandarakinum]|uniref:TVP38/TMEM64 family protein n=1 Tax=Streptosporangium sandarakinum TaxID=1260955 RepID=UPI0036877130